MSYGSGSFTGTEYTDKVTLGGFTVLKQSIGVASSATGFSDVDGCVTHTSYYDLALICIFL